MARALFAVVALSLLALVCAQTTCSASVTTVICDSSVCSEAVSRCSTAISCVLNQCGNDCRAVLYSANGTVITTCTEAPAPTAPSNTEPGTANSATAIIACGGEANSGGGSVSGGPVPASAATSVECPVCLFGHQLGSNGCPTCTCNLPPVCNEACPDLSASNCASILPPTDGRCCPICVPQNNCTNRACPQIACAISSSPGVDTYTYSDGCCTYCGQLNCSAVRAAGKCVDPDCPAGQAMWIPPGECCPQCTPTIKCDDIACPALACADNQKSVRSDGSCCPFCLPNAPNPCEKIACPAIGCAAGSVLTLQDGACCGTCVPVNTCNRTLCYDYTSVCHPVLQSLRDGDCCIACSPCRVIEGVNGNNIVCTANDDTLCDPAFSTDNSGQCTVPVHVVGACFDVRVNVTLLPNLDPTVSNQTVLKYAVYNSLTGETAAAVRAALPLLNVTVTSTTAASGDGSKFAVLHVCFTAPTSTATSNPGSNPSTLSSTTSQNLFNTQGFSATGNGVSTSPTSAPTSTSAAPALVASVAALVALVALAL